MQRVFIYASQSMLRAPGTVYSTTKLTHPRGPEFLTTESFLLRRFRRNMCIFYV